MAGDGLDIPNTLTGCLPSSGHFDVPIPKHSPFIRKNGIGNNNKKKGIGNNNNNKKVIGNNPASMRRAESGKAPLSSGENRSFSPINFGSQRISAVKRMHVYSQGREKRRGLR